MNTISVLIAVDALGAAATGSLQENVYVVDTNQYLGSWQQGTDQLHTVCQDGQHVNWAAVSVSPGNSVNILGFSGPMVTGKICTPAKQGIEGDASWQGVVETRGVVGQYAYTIQVAIDGKPMSFSPYLKVV